MEIKNNENNFDNLELSNINTNTDTNNNYNETERLSTLIDNLNKSVKSNDINSKDTFKNSVLERFKALCVTPEKVGFSDNKELFEAQKDIAVSGMIEKIMPQLADAFSDYVDYKFSSYKDSTNNLLGESNKKISAEMKKIKLQTMFPDLANYLHTKEFKDFLNQNIPGAGVTNGLALEYNLTNGNDKEVSYILSQFNNGILNKKNKSNVLYLGQSISNNSNNFINDNDDIPTLEEINNDLQELEELINKAYQNQEKSYQNQKDNDIIELKTKISLLNSFKNTYYPGM